MKNFLPSSNGVVDASPMYGRAINSWVGWSGLGSIKAIDISVLPRFQAWFIRDIVRVPEFV